MKTSRYVKPNYALTFGNEDVIFLSVKLLITEHSSPTSIEESLRDGTSRLSQYSVVIEECFLSTEMEFARHLIERLCPACSAEVTTTLMEDLKKLLLEDVTPSLHSLFYSGELVKV